MYIPSNEIIKSEKVHNFFEKEGKCPLCRVTVTGVEQGCSEQSFVV